MMKKLLAAGLLFIAASAVHADTLLGVYVGGSVWDMEGEGGFSNNTTLTNFNFDTESQGSFHVALEHFVPLFPNLKIRSTSLDTQGLTTISSQFVFGDEVFETGSSLHTDIDFGNTDYILYYEVLDNNLISIDVGLNFKHLDGSIYVQDTSDVNMATTEDLSGFMPMLYGAAQIGMPFSNFSFFAEGSFLAIEDHSISDYIAGLQYQLLDNMAVDFTVQLGYRSFSIELDDLDDIYSDLEFKGAYLGAELHF